MLILQNFEKHEPFCENMNFLTKFCEQLAKPIWQHWLFLVIVVNSTCYTQSIEQPFITEWGGT